jgi:SAM-dependent methyltransferase
MRNVDQSVVKGFGEEWSTFTQGDLAPSDRATQFEEYFGIFPWNDLPENAIGLDAGCGSGRWAELVAPRVAQLHLIDASEAALDVARQNLRSHRNVTFHLASISDIPLPDNSLDFAYSLGVLHHVPDTRDALSHIVGKLKIGAPLLVYIYYALDDRPMWFRLLFKMSNLLRHVISRAPRSVKIALSETIAALVYWPLARLAAVVDWLNLPTRSIPLEAYKSRTFYFMRTDTYDRFCTRLEKRFTRSEIEAMLRESGIDRIQFSERVPYWCAIGYKS